MTHRPGVPDVAPDGKPIVGPFDRAGWRAWLGANHATSSGVYLATWRRAAERARGVAVPYPEAVEEALCVGWIDAVNRTLSDELAIQWFAPRRPRSGWARSNKERVARLTQAGLMLPAGIAAVEAAKANGTWTMLDDVENLVVPHDLAAALSELPPAREHWDAFSKSARRGILEWIRQAKRPATRATRIGTTAAAAARNEKPAPLYPPERRAGTDGRSGR